MVGEIIGSMNSISDSYKGFIVVHIIIVLCLLVFPKRKVRLENFLDQSHSYLKNINEYLDKYSCKLDFRVLIVLVIALYYLGLSIISNFLLKFSVFEISYFPMRIIINNKIYQVIKYIKMNNFTEYSFHDAVESMSHKYNQIITDYPIYFDENISWRLEESSFYQDIYKYSLTLGILLLLMITLKKFKKMKKVKLVSVRPLVVIILLIMAFAGRLQTDLIHEDIVITEIELVNSYVLYEKKVPSEDLLNQKHTELYEHLDEEVSEIEKIKYFWLPEAVGKIVGPIPVLGKAYHKYIKNPYL